MRYLRLLPSGRARVPSRAISAEALASTKVSLLSRLKLASWSLPWTVNGLFP